MNQEELNNRVSKLEQDSQEKIDQMIKDRLLIAVEDYTRNIIKKCILAERQRIIGILEKHKLGSSRSSVILINRLLEEVNK